LLNYLSVKSSIFITRLEEGVVIGVVVLVLGIRIEAPNYIEAIVEDVVGGLVAYYS
jgi:hypothetical protein